MDDNLKVKANQNLKYLEDIKKYNEAHEKYFKQVFFKPQASQIKSSQVGAFVKDIYGVEQVSPVANIQGYHTRNSCELNTAIYANSIIDYNSPKTYIPGANELKVDGDFANSPNYFLSVTSLVLNETFTGISNEFVQTPNYTTGISNEFVQIPTTFTGISNESGQIFSMEIRGYIAAQKPGNYSVSINAIPFFKKNALIWVGNNAVKTYRKENAQFVVENGVQNKNQSFPMVTGQYTPFRIQYSGDTQFDYKRQPLWTNEDNYPISIFAKKDKENNYYYYSLSPSDKTNYYKCDVYKGSDLQKYTSNAKQQVKLVWQTPLDENTTYVFLDIIGNLCAYDAMYEKIGEPLYKLQDPNSNLTRPGRYKLELYQRKFQPLCIKNPDDSIVPITPVIEDIETIRNTEWEIEQQNAMSQNPLIKVMTNKEEQIGDKRISIDKISEINPLYSENFRYKLCIMRDRNNKKILALLTSFQDKRQFYTAEPELKMNKLFYANTYIENKLLKEVPASLQAYGNTYAKYSDMYPVSTNGYTETAYSDTNNCKKQCNDAGVQCNHFYKVTDKAGATKCLMSSGPVQTFLPKQPGSIYTSSTLNIKHKVIQTGDASKDAIYNKTSYVLNGYSDTMNLGYADYPIDKRMLSNTDIPGPNGTPNVIQLQSNIENSTTGTESKSTTNINSPMIAGVKEDFTVVGDSLTKLDKIDTQFKRYKTDQYTVVQNRIDISNNITSINQNYEDMSGNQKKYDFTGNTIYALEEDRTLESALLKDNAIYREEQNNLYMITTLTMATLLVAAILISK
jgi:hypothetical protein